MPVKNFSLMMIWTDYIHSATSLLSFRKKLKACVFTKAYLPYIYCIFPTLTVVWTSLFWGHSARVAGSCLPLVGSLQYRPLTNCMYWFPLPFQLPLSWYDLSSVESDVKHQINKNKPPSFSSLNYKFIAPAHKGWGYSRPLRHLGSGSG